MSEQNKEENQPPAVDDSPKFGRLLIVLFFAVMLVVAITVASEAFYSQ